jgi:enoyl-CoA hydratase/carnithine racemase
MSDYADIEVDVRDPVALIRLNRPKQLNAFTYQTLREIRSAVDAAADDPRVVGIVITGNGRGFCAGLDARALGEITRRGAPLAATPRDSAELPGIFSYLLDVPKPVIAAVNGVAAGGGLILALMSDVRIASRVASFTTVFLKRGLVSEHGSSWLLPRLVGTGHALDLLWASDRIDAETAHALGLVEKLAEPEDLIESARAYVERIAATSAPAAIAATKRLVYRHLGAGYEEALREAEIVQNEFVVGPDAAEGAAALLEKRQPRFRRLGESSRGAGRRPA